MQKTFTDNVLEWVLVQLQREVSSEWRGCTTFGGGSRLNTALWVQSIVQVANAQTG